MMKKTQNRKKAKLLIWCAAFLFVLQNHNQVLAAEPVSFCYCNGEYYRFDQDYPFSSNATAGVGAEHLSKKVGFSNCASFKEELGSEEDCAVYQCTIGTSGLNQVLQNCKPFSLLWTDELYAKRGIPIQVPIGGSKKISISAGSANTSAGKIIITPAESYDKLKVISSDDGKAELQFTVPVGTADGGSFTTKVVATIVDTGEKIDRDIFWVASSETSLRWTDNLGKPIKVVIERGTTTTLTISAKGDDELEPVIFSLKEKYQGVTILQKTTQSIGLEIYGSLQPGLPSKNTIILMAKFKDEPAQERQVEATFFVNCAERIKTGRCNDDTNQENCKKLCAPNGDKDYCYYLSRNKCVDIANVTITPQDKVNWFSETNYAAPEGYSGPLPPCAFSGTCRKVNQLVELAVNAANWVFGIMGSVAFLFFVYGGFMMIFSMGVSDRVTTGKNIIIYAVIGMVISLTAYMLINFLLNSLGVTNIFRVIK